MKVHVVVVYSDRYNRGHEKAFVPPLTGMHLAALVGEDVEVALTHEKIRPLDPFQPPDADLFMLTFGTGFAPRAYRLGDELRARGRLVVMGGPHVSVWPEEAALHTDCVVVGEAETVMQRIVHDAQKGTLEPLYRGQHASLEGLPVPRYDLLEPEYFVGRVVQATRGCPHACTFCSTPRLSPGWRTRPVGEVVRDLQAYRGRGWVQRRIAWFWDDNLTADRTYARELLQALVPLDLLWVTQTSLDCTHDEGVLDLMEASGCIGVFLGIETVSASNLKRVHKAHGVPVRQVRAIRKLHERGIGVMAGFLVGFDSETPEDVLQVAEAMDEIGIDVPFISVLTPFGETSLRQELMAAGHLLTERGWEFYNGYNVTYRPASMTPRQLERSHRGLWRRAFAPVRVARRVLSGAHQLRAGALALSLMMNGYYGLKNLRGTGPRRPGPAVGLGPALAGA